MRNQPSRSSAAEGSPPSERTVDELRRRIARGELVAGQRLPSTREITRRWGVAIATATLAPRMK